MIELHPGEIIVDSFAGGGGASLGIEMALGRSPDIAVNHDRTAIAVHQLNHPFTRHHCESVWDVDPFQATAGRPVGLAWFSPDCKHFSKAKGGKPVDKKIRGLAWVVIKWARDVQPRIIIVENVEEFQTWGPLKDGKPCPARKGSTFRLWLARLRRLGYNVEFREMRACDYGTPTTRKRLFVIARRDGAPIVWPAPTHGPGRAQPWLTAASCIDWSIPCPSIFDRVRPLKEATLRRIARGIKRYVIEAREPFLVPLTHTGSNRRPHPSSEPLPTVTTAKRGEFALVVPSLVQQGWGEREGQAPRCLDIAAPLGTIVGDGIKHALVTAFLAKHNGGNEATGQRLELPLDTVTTVDTKALVAVHLQRDFGGSVGATVDEPAPTVTAGGGGKSALVASHLVKLRGGHADHQVTAQDLRVPAATITAGGTHLAEVRALLIKYYGTGEGMGLLEPLHTVTTLDRFGLVMVEGEPWAIADIGMRMLAPRELARAQGFPDTYRLEIGPDGKPLSKSAQVKLIGNSVCPPLAAAIVRANVGAAVGADRGWYPPAHVAPGAQLSLFDLEAIA